MEIENLTNTIIEKEVEDELIWITVSKYALFMSYGKIGIDAKSLYEHYQFTAILQKTNCVKAVDRYCRQGLDWGRDRYEKAKQLLIDLNIIECFTRRGEDGKFSGSYIRVKTKRVELEPSDIQPMPENRQSDLPAIGETTTNALTNNLNALTNNLNALSPEILDTTQYLYDQIKTNVNPPTWNNSPPNLQAWSKHIDLLHRKDGVLIIDIKKVIDFCTRDDFWKTNILSAKKLREKFNTLFVKMKSPNKTGFKKPGYDPNSKQQADALKRILEG